jgi:hypothetical protein
LNPNLGIDRVPSGEEDPEETHDWTQLDNLCLQILKLRALYDPSLLHCDSSSCTTGGVELLVKLDWTNLRGHCAIRLSRSWNFTAFDHRSK